MKNTFIKVVNPKLAENLASLGFSYIKEGSVFVFLWSDELHKLVQEAGSKDYFVCENKLRF